MMYKRGKRLACILLLAMAANSGIQSPSAAGLLTTSTAKSVRDAVVRTVTRQGAAQVGRSMHTAGKMAVRAAVKELPKTPAKNSAWLKILSLTGFGYIAGNYTARPAGETLPETVSRSVENIPLFGKVYSGLSAAFFILSIAIPSLLLLFVLRSAYLILFAMGAGWKSKSPARLSGNTHKGGFSK